MYEEINIPPIKMIEDAAGFIEKPLDVRWIRFSCGIETMQESGSETTQCSCAAPVECMSRLYAWPSPIMPDDICEVGNDLFKDEDPDIWTVHAKDCKNCSKWISENPPQRQIIVLGQCAKCLTVYWDISLPWFLWEPGSDPTNQ